MKVAVVDYGTGNLHSVFKSVQAVQSLSGKTAEICLTDRLEDVSVADKVIFPGQGAMLDCIVAPRKSGPGEAVMDGLENKLPFGICVGAQLLFEHSEEGDIAGLDRFKGRVKCFLSNQTDMQGSRLKVSHMGWNTVRQTRLHPLFKDIAPDSCFYLVHNYYSAPEDPDVALGISEYPYEFTCIVGKDNVFATQFHMGKSHGVGLLLLRNFLDRSGG